MSEFLFYGFGLFALAGALGAMLHPNPLKGALSLVVTLLALAGIYALLHAHLVAGVQVLVYAGGILVLFVFIIMLLDLRTGELVFGFPGSPKIILGGLAALFPALLLLTRIGFPTRVAGLIAISAGTAALGIGFLLRASELRQSFSQRLVWSAIASIGLVGVFGSARLHLQVKQLAALAAPTFGGVKAVGRALLTDAVFPFEVVGVLLLVAAVASLTIARKPEDE